MIDERDIEEALRRMVEKHGGFCLKWVCPGWSGVPDRICLLPGGRVYFVELKRPDGGRVARLQEFWRGKLQRLGFDAYVVKDKDDIETLEWVIIDGGARG